MKKLIHSYLNTFKGLSKEVWSLAFITLINRAGTMVVPFLSLYLTESLSFDLKDVGWIMTCFGSGSVIGSWIGGKLTDKIGSFKIMVFSLTLTGLMFIGLQFIQSFTGFCIGIFILMIIADMFRPAMFVALSSYSKPENKTRSVTLIRLAINLGFSAGPAVGGLIITGMGYSGLFWLDGITCIFASILLINILSPKKSSVITTPTVNASKSAYFDGIFWIFALSMFLFGVVFLQHFSTIPLFYKDGHCLSEFQIGLLFGANGLLIFVFEMPLVKWLEDSKLSKEKLMIIGAVLVGFSFIILNITDWSGILIINLILVTFGEMIIFPFSNAFAMERSKRGNQGEYMAFYSIAFSFAHIFGHNTGMQLVGGYGFSKTWIIVGVLSFICLILLFVLKAKMNPTKYKQDQI